MDGGGGEGVVQRGFSCSGVVGVWFFMGGTSGTGGTGQITKVSDSW